MAIHLGNADHIGIAGSSNPVPERESSASAAHIQLHLWEHRSLFLGAIPDAVEVTPACSWLLVGLESPFDIAINDGQRISTRMALVPPGVEVCYFPEGGLQRVVSWMFCVAIIVHYHYACSQSRTACTVMQALLPMKW
jgi:hypothetical protein